MPALNEFQLPENVRNNILKKINELTNKYPCPRCGNNAFYLDNGILIQVLNKNAKNINLSGPSLPFIAVVCKRCGFTSFHNLVVLGIINSEGEFIE